MYKCYYHNSSSSAADFMSKLYVALEAIGWVKEKGLEIADGAAWQNSHAYAQGDVVKPTTANAFIYICSTAGTSAGSEPTWGTALKGETTSNTAKFRAYYYGRVYSSQSESDAEPKTYVYLYYTGADLAYCRPIGIIGVAQWAAATWLCGPYLSGGSTLAFGISANPCYFWVYGSKDLVMICTAYSSSYYYGGFGFVTPVWTQRTVLTAGATAGSTVNLAVANSADVHVGQYLQMWGATEEGRDKVLVSAVPDSTHITVTTLPRNYSSGSWIGVYPVSTAFMPCVNTLVSTGEAYMGWPCVGNEETPATAPTIDDFTPFYQLQAGTDPDLRLSKYLLRPVYGTRGYANYYHVGGYLPTDIILQQYKSCSSLDLFLVYDGYTYPVSGTAESGSATTLVDTDKALTTNAWIDYILVITAGTGVGQTRRIISNTATEFTVAAWETNPDSSSVYAVVEEAWRALGNGAVNCPVVKEII
jgi:hypothetical protein